MKSQKEMTYAELSAEIMKLQALAQNLREKEKGQAAQKVRELVESYGLSAGDLGLKPGKVKVQRGKYRQLYRDPETGAGWAGRGRLPRWLLPHLASGKSKEDFRVAA